MTHGRRAMPVVFWGTSDTGKPRVRILLEGLRAQGIEVIECRSEVWSGIEDKSQVKGAARWLGLFTRIAFAYPVLAWRYLRLPRHDWVLLGYPAILDVFVIRLLAWLRGTRIAMDWFLSAYDTVVLDRRLVEPRHPLAKALRAIEWLAVRLADRVFMDTAAHARRMEDLFGLAPGRCDWVWVGVEDRIFHAAAPAAAPRIEGLEPPADGRPGTLRVLFYGQFIPLHGITTIVEAARLLRDHPVDWLIVGRGQEAPRIRAMLDAEPLPAVRWLDWVDYPDLGKEIMAADVCLGIFGTSEKAASVIPNKVFQVLAADKPLLTRDSPAVRELVDTPMPGVALISAGDAEALAEAILRWQREPPVVCGSRETLRSRIRPAAIGRQLIDLLGEGRS